jgi:F0F1-type ATP synthase assembly protein I
MPPEKKKSSGNVNFRQAGPYIGLGTQFAATIILLTLLGDWLDSEWDTQPVFTLGLAFLGLAAALYNLIKAVTEIERRSKQDD